MILPSSRPVRVATLLAALSAVLTVAVLAGWTQPADDAVESWMISLEAPWLVEVSKVFDKTGSVPLVLVVILGGFLALAASGRWRTGLIWIAIVVITTGLSELVEEVVARPRPTSSLIIKSSFSYPSGHTMVSGVAIGVGLAWFASGMWSHRRRAYIAAGIIYAVSVSASRVYLRAHWWTDVVGGLIMATPVLILALVLWQRSATYQTDVGQE